MQALCRPGDIVLLSHDCHKSHHYALVLAGANPVYLDAYPLHDYSMYGGVPLREIKRLLLKYKADGRLHKVKMLLLTNCTFDGIVYTRSGDARGAGDQAGHDLRVGRGLVRLRPLHADLSPPHRHGSGGERCATSSATDAYRAKLRDWKAEFDATGPRRSEPPGSTGRCCPIPTGARVRVYATQSTHKTLTSLRQGSMIHVYDQDFAHRAHDAFEEAYMTHTSTSPNYQILASLDVGRRQVELEGYELVKKSVELAMTLRERIEEQPLLRKYFQLLRVNDLIPEEFRPPG